MSLTVAVATFGAESWRELAEQRAMPSAMAQAPAIHVHHPRGTLATARNEALDAVTTDRVVFLDADDELEPGFVEAMEAAPQTDLMAPAVRYIAPGRGARARMPKVAGHRHVCDATCLDAGNWLVVGTMAWTQMLRDIGGWEEWPMYEDWALWLRAWRHAGATVSAVPSAVYRAHVRPSSRNRAPSMDEKNAVHRMIVDSVVGRRVS